MKNLMNYDNLTSFFCFTNPLFYLWALGYLIFKGLEKLWQLTTIGDWYFIKFLLKNQDEETLKRYIKMADIMLNKNPYPPKRYVWKVCKAKAEKLLNNQ